MFTNKAALIKNNWIITGLILLAFLLRIHRFGQFPVIGETQDELAWTWMGTSILQGQPPTTWSGTNISGYKTDYSFNFHDQEYRIVSPYLDNPHLFSLIPGTAALMKGYTEIEFPSIKVIRFPMIIIGTMNVFLLYLVAKKLFTSKIATLATALYATIPTFVFASRVVVAENLLITFMLLAILLITDILHASSLNKVILLGTIGGLAILTKIAGLVIPIASLLILYSSKKTKQGVMALIISLVIGSAYFIYGLSSNPEVFLQVLSKQADFGIGFSTFLSMFIYPQLIQKTFIDGWVYIGLISLILTTISNPGNLSYRILGIFIIVQIAFLMAATPEVISHGWYKYPLFPLMAISIALLVRQFRQHPFFIPIFSLLVLFPTLRLMFISYQLTLSKIFYRILTGTGIVVGFLPQISQNRELTKKVIEAIITLAIAINILVVLGLESIVYWEDSLYFFPIRSGL